MEFPDEWLAYDKVPKDLRVMFETRNRKRKEVQKRLNSSSVWQLTVQYLRCSNMMYKKTYSLFIEHVLV